MASSASILAAFGICLVLATARRGTVVAGFAILAVSELLLAGSNGNRLAGVTSKRLALALAAIVVLGALAALLVRLPALVPPLVLVTAPIRLPLHFGGGQIVNVARGGELSRLVLLYLVLAAAALALIWRLIRGRPPRPLPRTFAYPAAAFLAFASLSLLWSDSIRPARNLLEFFLIPFAVLVVVVAQSPFPTWMPRLLGAIVVALSTLFAVVGLVEETTHGLLFHSSAVEIGNAYSNFFRVTSLFRDPSLYGRHVVLGMAILLVGLLYRDVSALVVVPLLVVLFAGLFFSYSQSSFAALFAVTIGVSLVAGDRTVRLIVAGCAVLFVLAGAGLVANKVAGSSTQRATSDRSRRVVLTAKVFFRHPLAGVGIGSQPSATQALSAKKGPPTFYVSHTTPLTVAAELGLIGLVLYAALLAGVARMLHRVWRAAPAFGLGLAAAFLALFVHSIFYTGLFDDPIAWLVPALAASFLIRDAPETAP